MSLLPILLIEDDTDLRSAHQELLELAGYEVHCAADGREALAQLVRVTEWGLILLDIHMPRMCGEEFLAHLSRRVCPIPLPIMVLSAHLARPPTGVLGLLTKPVSAGRLLDLARAHCLPVQQRVA